METLQYQNWFMQICPEQGGNLFRLRWKNKELLRSFNSPDEWEKAAAVYGIPVIFPPNRIDGAEFSFHGKKYRLPLNDPARNNHIHGLALNDPWELTGSDEKSVLLRWQFTENDPRFGDYPFACELLLKYELSAGALKQTFTIRNTGNTLMPCGTGFHTTFLKPLRLRIPGEGHYLEFTDERLLPTGKYLPWSSTEYDPSDWFDPHKVDIFHHYRTLPPGGIAELDYGDLQVNYRIDPDYSYWMLWTSSPEADYVCLEPMNMPVNAHNLFPEELPELPAGKSREYVSFIEIIGE